VKGLIKVVAILGSLAFLAGVFVLGIIIYISFDLPQINSLSDYHPPVPSRILSKDGEVLLEVSKEKREVVDFENIPKRVVDSFLAAEDDNFYNHAGVDYIGIARAMVKNIKAGKIVQGASTITQQVAKSLLLSSERTFTRKIKDFLLAKKIEEKFSKQDILYLYLNQVYLGGGYYGVKAAFKGYFGKALEEATIAESALIAGLLVAPGKYSPYNNPKYAKRRQKYVLGRLYKTKKITKEEFDAATEEDIIMQFRASNRMKAGYFTDWIRQRVIEKFGKEEFLSNGYEIKTTLNWKLQKKAEEEVLKGVIAIDKRQGYKGALGNFGTEELVFGELEKQRMEMFKEASKFFTFYKDGSTKKEYAYEREELEKNIEFYAEEEKEIKSRYRKYFVQGNKEDDKMNDLVKNDENYFGIVTKVSNLQRMIYVTFAGGLRGIIPYEEFRWAHKREISEERGYWSYLTRPTQMFKPGDKIYTKLLGKNKKAWTFIHTDFKKLTLNKDFLEKLQNQKYYLLSLEQEVDAQGALLSISPYSGEIVAMVGGSDFSKSQFNRAVQSNRQPGSAFKPLIFAVGLENKYTAASILLDSPSALGGADESLSWKPRNYDGKFKGQMTFRRALETSRNIPTIRLTQDVGVSNIISFVDRLNLDIELPKDLSVSLGSFGMNLLDLVKTYSIFPNGGRKVKLKSILEITDRNGNLYTFEEEPSESSSIVPEVAIKDESKKEPAKDGEGLDEEALAENPFHVNLNENQVYDERLAYIMTNLLKGVVQNGTGQSAKSISPFLGGKTGTTNNYIDAWFLGFSSKLVTGVWTGFDNNKTLGWGETGAKSALPIWKEFMKLGIKTYGESDFKIPSGILNLAIDKKRGTPVKSNSSGAIMEAFVEGTEPGAEKTDENNQDTESTDAVYDDEDYYNNQ
jgi:penicillin-binding protein 1A